MTMKKILLIPVAFLFILFILFAETAVAAPDWNSVERLIKEQKATQVSRQIDHILKQAKRQKDNKSWQQALILNATIKSQTGQFENALKYLNQPWPRDNESQMLLNLHKAYLIINYIQAYRWEIQQREKISSRKSVALKKKTMTQLVREINQSFAKAYTLAARQDKPLDSYKLPIANLKNYFVKPSYPANVRGNIRDTITYLWVDFLQDSSLWSPQQSSAANAYSLQELLAVSYRDKFGYSANVNPLKRLLWLLSDLEHYELSQKKPEAALEAFRVKIEKLSQTRTAAEDLKQLIHVLRQRINQTNRALPWVNMLRNTLAKLLQKTNTDDANIQSVAVLKQCLAQHPKHNATAFCKTQFERITKPSIQLTSMKSDGLQKRSLLVNHANVSRVYFRAWKINLAEIMHDKLNERARLLMQNPRRRPDAQWQSNVPDKKDYKPHDTYIVPPLKQYGYWFIAASTDPGFNPKNEKSVIVSSTLNLTRLVAEVQTGGSLKQGNIIKVSVFDGESGEVVRGANVELWSANYSHSKRLMSAVTSAQGDVTFKLRGQNEYRVVAKRGNDFTLAERVYAYTTEYSERVSKSSLVFSDRALYRPSQKIHWKVVAYQGDPKAGKYHVFVNDPGWVKLFDANGKVVRHISVKTNRYGSASGEFIARTGRLLGNWRIATSWGGSKSVRVEEYKRPSFSVKINPSDQELALNKPAIIKGQAKYYFGQTVTGGKVKWHVKRQSLSLWEFGGRGVIKDQIIASGQSQLDAAGYFRIRFVPKTANPKQLQGLNKQPEQYTYVVTAEFTDSGGETRTANRSFTIGKTGVLASISAKQHFGIAGKPYKLNFYRSDANHSPRPGNAYWQLYQIVQPAQPKMPADEIRSGANKPKSRFATKGDLLQPRWQNSASYPGEDKISAAVKNWKDGRKIRQGTLQHDKSGAAEVSLKGLGAGLYRLRYTTKDRWGQVYKTEMPFVIAFQEKTAIRLPSVLKVQNDRVEVGDKVTYLAGSGFRHSPVIVEIYHGNDLLKRTIQRGIRQLDFAVSAEHRGGLTFVLSMLKDYQLIRESRFVNVPWTNKKLNVTFSTFRDKLQPGQKEKWRISVKNSKDQPLEKGAVEVLASMYDRSLDLIAPHSISSVASLYHQQSLSLQWHDNLGIGTPLYSKYYHLQGTASYYQEARLKLIDQGMLQLEAAPATMAGIVAPAPMVRRAVRAAPRRAVNVHALQTKMKANGKAEDAEPPESYSGSSTAQIKADSSQLDSIKSRTNFNETAFFYPHLLLEDDGSVAFEFEVPESLTEWKVWVSAISRDLRGGDVSKFATTSKELMVRPYLPRFLRAGDHAYIEVLVNNASDKLLSGQMDFDVLDAATLKSIARNFKLTNTQRAFKVAPGRSTRLRFSIVAPQQLGMVAIRARATAATLGDGEQRPVPILPSRIHLTQSRFAALQGSMSRNLQFKQLAQNNDPTRINDKLVVTVDGQLFYTTLNALPYLVKYPYECTEQTMNRFLSTAIINSVFKDHPAIAKMAGKLAKRDTQFAKWEQIDKDPNRKMLLEETPWLNEAQGGKRSMHELIRILNPNIARGQAQQALLKLRKAQTASGGFPWWDGGRESVYMTAYLLHGFSRALEFKVDVPKDMVQKAWKYLAREYKKYHRGNNKPEHHYREITLLNYVLSSYPDNSWTGGVFSRNDRQTMLNLSFRKWRQLPGLLKAYLALTLKRAGRSQDAKLVFDSIMDSAKTDQELGTYWAPEERSWLWYNDRIDTHAFILRAMMELDPGDKRRHGLVQWLMLNKKLNHWKSTRATAESIYSLVHYLKKEKQLGMEQRALIKIGNLLSKTVVFKPNEYTGKAQLVVEGSDIQPAMANISVQNQGKSLMFASASWHFSTDRLPKSAQGDFFNVSRRFFKRVQKGKQWQLQPLQEGAQIRVGDQLEIQLSLRAKHAAEFVHLRAPRGAGFEPMEQRSGYRWDTGIGYYEEIRDSGANFFFEWLPAGEYSFKYRLRASTAGEFRVAPASVQSIYAPEFNAYSSGKRLQIR